jgi:AcrR family transcriptional regulator
MSLSEIVDLREKILEKAAHLFVLRGYNGISMREIAEELGVSKAALYYHFKDKQDLMLAVLNSYLEDVEHLMDSTCQSECNVQQQITHFVQAVFAQPPQQRAIIRLASQEMAQLTPQAQAAFGILYHEKFIGRIEELLVRGMKNGELRTMDSNQTTWILLGMMYPFFYADPGRNLENTESLAKLIATIFLEGVRM